MKTYTLKLKTTSTTNYNLYDGTTLVSDTDLGTLFGSAGEAYFTFDFNSLTPTNTTSLTILDSQDTAVITNTGLSGIAEDKNFKGTWSASATAFDSLTLLTGVAMDEAQLGKLAGMIKDGGIKTLTEADYDYHDSGTVDNSVALWRLAPGIYRKPEGIYAHTTTTYRLWDNTQNFEKIIIVTPVYGSDMVGITVFGGALLIAGAWRVSKRTGLPQGIPNNISYYQNALIYADMVEDNLTSTLFLAPLSANQGRVLNNKIVGTTETTTIATTDWTALSSSDPYDYSATVTATASINASTGVVELLNDQPALFGTYGFAIGAVSGQSVTIYSIGQPDASVSLKLNIRNL